jgi:transcriptional regulator with XRE-family HTH domain
METKQMYFNFADWLRNELLTRRMTVVKLATMSGVHPNTIRNYLSFRCEPSLYNVNLIVAALGYRLEVVKRDNK